MPEKKQTQKKATYTQKDIDDNKVIALLAYIIFFLPLIATPKSSYGKYHAKQGLVLLIFAVIVNVVGGLIPILGWFIILPLGNIVCLIFAILGIVNAVNGQAKDLPYIGQFAEKFDF